MYRASVIDKTVSFDTQFNGENSRPAGVSRKSVPWSDPGRRSARSLLGGRREPPTEQRQGGGRRWDRPPLGPRGRVGSRAGKPELQEFCNQSRKWLPILRQVFRALCDLPENVQKRIPIFFHEKGFPDVNMSDFIETTSKKVTGIQGDFLTSK